jgi:pilus assembly protein CpaF
MSNIKENSIKTLTSGEVVKLRNFLINAVAQEVESNTLEGNHYREQIEACIESAIKRTKLNINQRQRKAIFEDVIAEMIGYGPIHRLLDDPKNNEIMVCGPDQIYVERHGRLVDVDIHFDDSDHLMRIIDRILHSVGRHVNRDSPTADARLPDGSRVNVVIPPVAIDGPCLTIRKFLPSRFSVDQFITLGSITQHMVEFLKACVAARLNIIITGNTSSGKTTLLNILTGFIPGAERIITIEDAAELQLKQKYVVRMETRPGNVEGRGGITTRDLVRNALRMRPDRLIVGEVRSGEALDMLQAMNTGHDGSLTTLHSNSPRDAISRMETMTLMSGIDLPIKAIRSQISSAIDLIVHMDRLPDGTRKVVRIAEVPRMEGDVVTLSDLFKFEQIGIDNDGKVIGKLKATGLRPVFTPRLEVAGFYLGADVFGVGM